MKPKSASEIVSVDPWGIGSKLRGMNGINWYTKHPPKQVLAFFANQKVAPNGFFDELEEVYLESAPSHRLEKLSIADLVAILNLGYPSVEKELDRRIKEIFR